MTYTDCILRAIKRHAATVTGHRNGCICRRCSRVRVAAKRYARVNGWINEAGRTSKNVSPEKRGGQQSATAASPQE